MGSTDSQPLDPTLPVVEPPQPVIVPLDPIYKMVQDTGTGIALLSAAECIVVMGALVAQGVGIAVDKNADFKILSSVLSLVTFVVTLMEVNYWWYMMTDITYLTALDAWNMASIILGFLNCAAAIIVGATVGSTNFISGITSSFSNWHYDPYGGTWSYYDDFRYDRFSLVFAGMIAVPELIAGVVMSRNVGILNAEGA